MPEIIGYIVEGKPGALALYTSDFHEDYPKAGVLLQADHATVFKTRGRAERAIARTIAWYNSHTSHDGTHWDYAKNFGRPRIKRLVS